MRLTRILAVFVGLLAVGVIALAAFLKSIDLNEYRDLIAEQVKQATGRDLKLAGETQLTVSLTPTITVSDVSFSNAAWGSRPEMVVARRVEVQIELLPLISGNINVKRLVLVEPDVLLETDAQGRGNWELEEPVAGTSDGRAAGSSSGDAVIPMIQEILITGGRLIYKDGRTGETDELVVERLGSRAESISSPLNVAAVGAYNGNSFSVQGTLGSVARLASGDSYPLDLRAEAGGASLTIKGEIGQALSAQGLDLVIGAEGANIAGLSPLVGRTLPAFGPYNVRLRLTDADGRQQISDLAAEIGKRGEAFLAVTGTVRDVLAGTGLDLSLTVEGRELKTLGEFVGLDLPAIGPVSARGRLTDAERVYTFQDFRATVGESDLVGKASINIAGARPLLIWEVTSSLLDLGALLPSEGESKAVGAESSDRAAGTDDRDRLFSDAPLPLDELKAADATLTFHGKRVTLNAAVFEDVALELTLKEGALVVHLVKATYGGSELSADVSIDSRPAVPTLKADINANRLDIGRLLTEMQITDLVKGEADIAVHVRGNGTSVRAIMGGLSGDASLVTGEGRIDSSYVDLLAADLLQAIGSSASTDGQTKFNCFVSRFEAENGLATSKGILFDTRRITVVGEGKINLGSEELDLILKPRPKDPSLLSLATPIRVRGTLAHPSIAPDTLAVAKDAAGAVIGAAATGGIGLLLPFLSAGSGDKNPCITALAEARSDARQSAGTTSPTSSEQSRETENGGLRGLLDGVGNAIRGLFGSD